MRSKALNAGVFISQEGENAAYGESVELGSVGWQWAVLTVHFHM